MNTISFIAPWMAFHSPGRMTQDSMQAFAKSVAELATRCDVFPPVSGAWSHAFDPVEHAFIFVPGVPYCKAAVFKPAQPAEKSATFGAFDERAPDECVIFADRRKIRTRFSPSRRLAVWLRAVQRAFPGLGEVDQGIMAAHLCRAHIEASHRAPFSWSRVARITFGWRGDYTHTAIDLQTSSHAGVIKIPHHFLWEEALDDIMRFAAKEAREYFMGFAPRSETDEEIVDGMQSLARYIEEQHLVSDAYVRDNPHLLDMAISFRGDEIDGLPEAESAEEEESGLIIFEEEEEEDDGADPLIV